MTHSKCLIRTANMRYLSMAREVWPITSHFRTSIRLNLADSCERSPLKVSDPCLCTSRLAVPRSELMILFTTSASSLPGRSGSAREIQCFHYELLWNYGLCARRGRCCGGIPPFGSGYDTIQRPACVSHLAPSGSLTTSVALW